MQFISGHLTMWGQNGKEKKKIKNHFFYIFKHYIQGKRKAWSTSCMNVNKFYQISLIWKVETGMLFLTINIKDFQDHVGKKKLFCLIPCFSQTYSHSGKKPIMENDVSVHFAVFD